MNYKKVLPRKASFEQTGLKGYNYSLETKEISISISISMEESFKGHDKYHTNVYSRKIYYVIEGNGTFKVNGETILVKKDDVIEIPSNTEFVFAGKMRLLLIMSPAFRPQDGRDGKDNDLYEKGEK